MPSEPLARPPSASDAFRRNRSAVGGVLPETCGCGWRSARSHPVGPKPIRRPEAPMAFETNPLT